MTTTQERRTENELAQDALRIPVGPPPLAVILADGDRTRRRRTVGVGVAAAALLALGALGATTFVTQGTETRRTGDGMSVASQRENVPGIPAATVPLPAAGEGQWLHRAPIEGAARQRGWQETWLEGGDSPGVREYRILWPEGDELMVEEATPVAVMLDEDVTDDELRAWILSDSGDLRGLRAAHERLSAVWTDPGVSLEFKERLVPAALGLDGVSLREGFIAVGGRDAFVVDIDAGHGHHSHYAFAVDSHEYLGGGFEVVSDDPEMAQKKEIFEESTVVDALPERARGAEQRGPGGEWAD